MRRSSAKTGFAYAILLLAVLLFVTVPSTAQAQYIPCTIANLVVIRPDSVPAGQTLTTSTSMTASCDNSAPYTLRVDLVDQRTGTVLSSVKLPFYATNSGVTKPINNTATAPSSTGPWVLQIQAYLINGFSGQVAASSQQQFVVNITQYVPQTTATTAFSVFNSTMATFSTYSNQTVQSSTNSSISLTSTYTTSESTILPTLPLIGALTLVILIAAAVFFIMMWRKRKTAPLAQTGKNPKHCTQCGSALTGNESFCGKCGSKQ